MLERINVLKAEIERLGLLARKCDPDIAQQFLSLADEMQHVVNEMERIEAQKAESAD
jgi:uncharacterized small protein (DUF1192 family)